MKEIRVNNYVATVYNEGEVVIDTRGSVENDKQMQANDGRVFLTTRELEDLLALSKGISLSEKLETLILMATKQAGSYDPNEALTYIEEQLTMDEVKLAEKFLRWVHTNKKTFGHGNIQKVFAEFKESK